MTHDLQIDSYLSSLRTRLSPLPLPEREEILREIGAHIIDSAGESGDVNAVLERLGSPDELAAQYRNSVLIRRASRSFSPVLLLRATLRLAAKGMFATIVFFSGMFGYLLGGGMILSALMKGFFPTHTGLWMLDGRIVGSGSLFPSPQAPAQEVLGWWYIPLALTIGGLLLSLTTFAIRGFLRVSQGWQTRLRGA